MLDALSSFFDVDVRRYVAELEAIEKEISPETIPRFDEIFERVQQSTLASERACRRLEDHILENPDLLQETQIRFREVIAPWFDQSWFMERGKNKPRGYPGDYLTLDGIYNDAPKGTGLGGYLDLYFLNTTLAIAVKDRLRTARTFLMNEVHSQERTLNLLNVACGPCREYTHGWDTGGRPVSVTLVDMDREALAFADERIAKASPSGLACETATYNALRMSSAENNVKRFGRPDIIYSIGLCDYVPDNYLIRILRGWRESLSDGGIVYVAFKDCVEYDPTCYAWHVDWHFISRNEDDCRRLFAEAGYEMDRLDMTRGESPVIMNFVYRTVEDAAAEVQERSEVDAGITIR